jgi:putative FmdB family regulatory protein
VPTYQYACTECGHGFEAVQAFSDDALTECPTCGGRLRKVFNSVGIVFKGSGFYRTDSREKPGGVPAKSSDDKPAATKTDGGSADTPAAKTDGAAAPKKAETAAGTTKSSTTGSAA